MSSNLYKIGTIYSRINGLLRKNALKKEDAPIWYDVYARFPPKYEPRYGRPAPEQEIPEIFYPEDKLRAQLHSQFSNKIGIINFESQGETNSQKWIKTYKTYIAEGMTHDEALSKLSDFIKNFSSADRELKQKTFRNKSADYKIDLVQIMDTEPDTTKDTNVKSEKPKDS